MTDTNRVNLYTGLFPAEFSRVKKKSNGSIYRLANGKAKGFLPISWEDYPFEWEKEKISVVQRSYLTGPIKHYRGTIELFDTEDPEKTKVVLTATFLPRNIAGIAAIPLVTRQNIQKKFDYLDTYLSSGAESVYSLPQKKTGYKVNVVELNRLTALLKKFPVEERHVELLHTYLLEESIQNVAQMETMKIAEHWKMDAADALKLFLYATKAGLLNLSWNLICPNCRVSKAEFSSLSDVQPTFHCDLCGVNYDADFDQSIELIFSVHSSIRESHAETYCIGGPYITPHIWIQKMIPQGSVRSFSLPAVEDEMQLRVLQANATVPIESNKHSTQEQTLVYTDEGWQQTLVESASKLTIRNASSGDILLVVEQQQPKKQAVTAAQVTALQEFRDLFSSEVLSPGQKIAITHVTILFTDLKGSTSLYESVGDANAFGQVREHFEYITKIVASNSGSIVKTIGDAVMAVFHLPQDGLKAALEIQSNLSEFNADRQDAFVLKAGLFSGPAIAVNSNDRLDYFGRTVNMAARIQEQSQGDDLVLSHDVLKHPDSMQLLSDTAKEFEAFSVSLKGMEGDQALIRVCTKNTPATETPNMSPASIEAS